MAQWAGLRFQKVESGKDTPRWKTLSLHKEEVTEDWIALGQARLPQAAGGEEEKLGDWVISSIYNTLYNP